MVISACQSEQVRASLVLSTHTLCSIVCVCTMATLSPAGPDQLLQVTDPAVSSLGSVAVDWVFNEVYWIENSGSSTRVS